MPGRPERIGEIKAFHRDVATRAELEHYLGKWTQAKYKDYNVQIPRSPRRQGPSRLVERQRHPLDELADLLGGGSRVSGVRTGLPTVAPCHGARAGVLVEPGEDSRSSLWEGRTGLAKSSGAAPDSDNSPPPEGGRAAG